MLTPRDRARVAEARARLGRIDLDERASLAECLQVFTDLVEVEVATAYTIERDVSAFRVPAVEVSGLSRERVHQTLQSFLGTRQKSWGVFDPILPEPRQRNRAIDAMPLEEFIRTMRPPLLRSLGVKTSRQQAVYEGLQENLQHLCGPLGFSRMHQLRALICDGPVLLAWYGGFRPGGFQPRDREVLQALTPMVLRRMKAEETLHANGADRAALGALLERMGRPAFILSSTGALRHANSSGAALLQSRTGEVHAALRAAVRGGHPGVELTPIGSRGLPPQFLALWTVEQSATHPRVQRAAARWALTPRQAQVLALLAEGCSNKAIAARLGCAVHTVELHVSAIFARANVETRAQVCAALLSFDH